MRCSKIFKAFFYLGKIKHKIMQNKKNLLKQLKNAASTPTIDISRTITATNITVTTAATATTTTGTTTSTTTTTPTAGNTTVTFLL